MRKSYTLQELADLLDCKLYGSSSVTINGIGTLKEAGIGQASFLSNPIYKKAMLLSQASVIIVGDISFVQEGKNFLLAENPSKSFQKLLTLLEIKPPESGFKGIHETAIIHETAVIGENVLIGPYAVIDKDVCIGQNVVISAHCYIGALSSIGTNSYLYPNVTIREKCTIKERVIIQPGAVIGSCGFGYLPDKTGAFQKLEQLGGVVLEEDVEIGANTTIDRARFTTTIIRKGTKIDNLVQIAHNVEIGEYNAIAAQTGIAGSAKTGKHVIMGGQTGIVGHVEIAPCTKLATRAGVNRNLKEGTYRGSPAFPIQEYNRQKVHVKRLSQYVQRIQDLEKRLEKLEER